MVGLRAAVRSSDALPSNMLHVVFTLAVISDLQLAVHAYRVISGLVSFRALYCTLPHRNTVVLDAADSVDPYTLISPTIYRFHKVLC